MIKRAILLVGLGLLGWMLVRNPAFQTVAAGVAIFLFGMLFMEHGFQALTGGILKKMLARCTDSLFKSQLFGFAATALMQSSSLVTVITISTLTAGLITLTAGIGIVFGANIGTTTGAWIMAGFGLKMDIARFAMPMIVLGLVLRFQKQKEWQGLGNVLSGIGFVFLGIHYMKTGSEIWHQSFDLSKYAMPGLAGLVVYTMFGMIATVVMQSSHATLMITIAALAANQITYDNALALAIGSNIGTTITAVIGALSANAAGQRLAWAHVLFNVVTGAIAIVFIEPFKWTVNGLAGLAGIAPDNWTLRLATFHTLFNVVGVALMTPFIGRLVRLLETYVKPASVETEEGAAVAPAHLSESALALPDTALEAMLKETQRLIDILFEVVAHGLNLRRSDIVSERDLSEVVARSSAVMDIDVAERYDHNVRTLYRAIAEFATRAPAKSNMNESQMTRVNSIRRICRDVGEIVRRVARFRPTINLYMTADNAAMREQYNLFRREIAQAFRALFALRDSAEPAQVAATLKQVQEELEKGDALANGTIDRLVRQGAITPAMGINLMNDSATTAAIGNRLVAIAQSAALAKGLVLPTEETT